VFAVSSGRWFFAAVRVGQILVAGEGGGLPSSEAWVRLVHTTCVNNVGDKAIDAVVRCQHGGNIEPTPSELDEKVFTVAVVSFAYEKTVSDGLPCSATSLADRGWVFVDAVQVVVEW